MGMMPNDFKKTETKKNSFNLLIVAQDDNSIEIIPAEVFLSNLYLHELILFDNKIIMFETWKPISEVS